MYSHHGPFTFDPLPPPDHIHRSIVRKNEDNGGRFEGEVDEKGLPDGRGVRFVPSEYFYEGYFIDGKPNGRGRKIYDDGELDDGEFLDGKLHGLGL